jgi:K(+)-stimulated pyrophosphate-energized sodium pump
VIVISLVGLAVAYWLARWVLKKDTGSDAMKAISNAIKEGAEAFLRRQNKTIVILAAIFVVALEIAFIASLPVSFFNTQRANQ